MLFENMTGGMKNLPVVFFIPMLGIKILMLVLFGMTMNILTLSDSSCLFYLFCLPSRKVRMKDIVVNRKMSKRRESVSFTRDN